MLRKKEEKKEKVKDEAYYAKRLEEVPVQPKNLSLLAKGGGDDDDADDGTYQIWSSGSDDEEMCHPTPGVMFAKHVGDLSSKNGMVGDEFVDNDWEASEKEIGKESEVDDEMLTGRCFISTTSRSQMTVKVHDHLFLLMFL